MQHTVKEDYTHPELEWVGDDKLIFITAHRRENLGEPMPVRMMCSLSEGELIMRFPWRAVLN